MINFYSDQANKDELGGVQSNKKRGPSTKGRYIQGGSIRPGTSGQSMGGEEEFQGIAGPYNASSNNPNSQT